MAEWIAALVDWLPGTPMAALVVDYRWAWPICESLHFTGLVMVFGAVSLVDLRVLGLGQAISFQSTHRLIGVAFAGIAISAVTGLLFISGTPDQYFYNAAFHWKLVCFAVLVVNMSWFYRFAFPQIKDLSAGQSAPTAAKVSAAISLAALIGTMSAGRMLTFFRPAWVG